MSDEFNFSMFSKAVLRMCERQEEDRVKFNQALGEPAVFVPDGEDPRFGTGYWKGQGGVFSYRRYANGYDPYSRVNYSTELIDLLVLVDGRALT